MKKLLCLFLSIFAFLPCYAHGEDISFEAKYKKVTLDQVAVKTLGIKTKRIKEEIIADTIKTTGQIEEIPSNQYDINFPVQGKIKSILVNLGDYVKSGQALAIVQSTEVARLQTELNQFKAELELAKSSYEREKFLLENGVSAKKEFEAAKTNLIAQEAKLNAAQSSLKIITNLTLTSTPGSEQGTFTIKAQKEGIVLERKVTAGQSVSPDQILFHIGNLSEVWASADIYEKDQNKIKLDQEVDVTLDGEVDKIFKGKITYVGSVINKETRTLPVKATLNNVVKASHEIPLRPGAFIQMLIHVGQNKKLILIPRTALVEVDTEGVEGNHKHIVYLKKKNMFVPRKIKVLPHDSNIVEVLSGLIPGEIIVTQGAYQLQFEGGAEEDKKERMNFLILIGIIAIALVLVIGLYIGKKKARL